jgi:hypothetical protein
MREKTKFGLAHRTHQHNQIAGSPPFFTVAPQFGNGKPIQSDVVGQTKETHKGLIAPNMNDAVFTVFEVRKPTVSRF